MNVHILSDTPRATSAYANITRNLALGLVERGHKVTITGFLNGYENYHGINVLPLATPFSPPQVQFANNLRSSKAEVLICIHEAHTEYAVYSQMFQPTFFWVPVEGEEITPYMSQNLRSPTLKSVVSMSKDGAKQLEAEGIPSEVIYPGWNPEIFTKNPAHHCKWSMDIYSQMQDPRVLSDRGCLHCTGVKEGCKYSESERVMVNIGGKEFSGTPSGFDRIKDNLGARIVIGCVAQNEPRKRLERLIEAFSKMEYKKDALLHIHTLPVSPRGFNLFNIARRFNVLDRIIFSYSDNPVLGISDHGINLLYNYFDFIATASGYEGFGMPVLESAAVGKPAVASRCGSFPELLGENERGLLASVATSSMDPDGISRALVDTNDLAAKMDTLCNDASLRVKLGNAGEEWAKQFTWEKVVKKWDTLLSETEEKVRIAQRGSYG